MEKLFYFHKNCDFFPNALWEMVPGMGVFLILELGVYIIFRKNSSVEKSIFFKEKIQDAYLII